MAISLEIGFRFLPPEEEIIIYFLLNKMNGDDHSTRHIREVDLLKQEPWDLPDLAIVRSKYQEWLFFYKLNKISKGKNERATQAGSWKSTGPDRLINYGGRVVGSKKTLVFHTGRSPRGVKTDWVMHEYRACADLIPSNANNCYVVGILRNKAAENPENSISNYGQPSRQFGASTCRNDAAGVTSIEVPPPPQYTMDYEIALQTQMEDQGIFDYDLSPFNGLLNLPSSSASTSNEQNKMEDGLRLEDIPPSNDLVDNDDLVDALDDVLVDDEQNDLLAPFPTIDPEVDFMASMFSNQEGYPSCIGYQMPDYAEGDHILMSDGTGPSQSERFNMKRMENGFHQDDILVMGSGDYSATVTKSEINCLNVVGGERSMNSRTCKSQYEPRSHMSVVQGQPKGVQLQGKSSGETVSRDKARKSGVRGPVVELVQNKISPLQSNQDRKMDQYQNEISDLKSRSNHSTCSCRKSSDNYLEASQLLSCKQIQQLEYVVKVLLGVALFMLLCSCLQSINLC